VIKTATSNTSLRNLENPILLTSQGPKARRRGFLDHFGCEHRPSKNVHAEPVSGCHMQWHGTGIFNRNRRND
jgi:hypothetical protein